MNEEKETSEFYPYWNENCQSENPFSVIIVQLTRRQAREVKAAIRFTKVKGFREQFQDNSAEVLDRIFLENTVAFKNFKHPINGRTIITAEEAYDAPGLNDLITEIIDIIQDASALRPEQVKKSAPLSAGTTVQPTSGGIAPSA